MSQGIAIRKNGVLCYKILKYNTTPKVDVARQSGDVENSAPPVLYYDFEGLGDGAGTATQTDLSVKGLASPSEDTHNGAVDAADRCYTPQARGDCSISTAAGDEVAITDHADLDWGPTDKWTFAGYVAANTSTYAAHYVKRNGASDYRGPAIFTYNGYLQLYLVDNWATNKKLFLTGSSGVGSARIVGANTWHHLVVTYDGSTNASGFKAYVNGAEQSLENGKLGIDATGDNLSASDTTTNSVNPLLGQDTAAGGYPPGGIDDTAIWKGVCLTESQVQVLYNSASVSWGDGIDPRRGL